MPIRTLFFCLCLSGFALASTNPDSLQTENHQLKETIDSLQNEIQQTSHTATWQDDTLIKVTGLAMLTFIAAFSFLVFVFYRRRRELIIKQQQNELKHQLSEIEMKALRSQINPHFIFNCMNSIYKFMQQNDTQQAGEYLVKFSNLIRLILENSMHKEVALADDIKALKLYIEMEQMRMNHKFEYSIDVESTIDAENTLVPPMIVQPFVENSIWHGLNNNSKQGNLTIKISQQNDLLIYNIEDDGEENSNPVLADELQENKKTSLGMSLTQERIDLMNKMKNNNAGFTISDIRTTGNTYIGKRVVLHISFETAL